MTRRLIGRLASIGVLLALACGSIGGAAETESDREGEKATPKFTVQAFDKVEVVQYPWGWIRWLMNAEIDPDAEMTFGVVYIKPHQENPAHLHPN